MRADEQEPDTRPTVAGDAATPDEAHIHQDRCWVNLAVAHRRRLNLPREICGMSQNVTEGEAIHSDRAVEVS